MKDKFPSKQIKRQLSWEGHPTHQPAKSLRHNEKEKKLRKIFFSFHPSGLIPFPFGSSLPFPFICFLFFLFFLLETNFKDFYGYMQSLEG